MEASALGPYLDLMVVELERLGYSRLGIRRWLGATDSFSQWLAREGLHLADITESVADRYCGSFTDKRCNKWLERNTRHVLGLMEFLRRQGSVAPETPKPPVTVNIFDAFLVGLDHDMEQAIGLAPSTRSKYLRQMRAFIRFAFGDAIPDWPKLQTKQVTQFIQERSAKLAAVSRREVVKPLRTLLSILIRRGELHAGFGGAIPPVRAWKHAGLPRHVSEEELLRVIALCRKETARGRRDRAMLLLLARLGLRPGEVLRLSLQDIDWRNGSLLIRAGKTHRERSLPLPQDAGEALLNYITMDRPKAINGAVFLALNPPHKPIKNSQVVSKVVVDLLRQAGVCTARPGAYVLRHTLATHMVRRGASFKQIADVLGHRQVGSTAGYAKLNLSSLAQVALPWPGELR